MRTNRKRVQVPFLFRAADGLGASGKLIARCYGAEVEGVFTRAGAKRGWDANDLGMVFPHSLPPLHVINGEPVLNLGPAATNLCLQSENFGTTWTTEGSPTRSAAALTHQG